MKEEILIKELEILEKEFNKKDFEIVLECVNNYIFNRNGVELRRKCDKRCCPVCSTRLKIQEYKKILKKLEEYNSILFLTLNGKNLTENYEKELKKIKSQFNKIIKLKELDKITLGYVRVVEMKGEKKKFKPHIHTILVVKDGYKMIWSRQKTGIKEIRKKIEKKWGEYNGNGEKNLTDLRAVGKTKKDKENLVKYLTGNLEKQMFNMNESEIRAYLKTVKGTNRVYSYGGVMRNKKRLKKVQKL